MPTRDELEVELRHHLHEAAPSPRADALARLTGRLAAAPQRTRSQAWLQSSLITASWGRVGVALTVAAAALAVGITIGEVARPMATGPSPSAVIAPSGVSSGPRFISWMEPASYSFVVEGCGPNDPIGTLRIFVTDGEVRGFEALDEAARVYERGYPLDAMPTLGWMVEQTNDALSRTDPVLSDMLPPPERSMSLPAVVFESDPADGHPTYIRIDWRPEAVDDELCYRIRQFEAEPLTSQQPGALEWIEPNLYEFVLDSTCGERSGLGRYWIKVAGGRVDELQPLDAQAGRDPMDLSDAPTLGVLLNRAAYASSGAYKPRLGRGSEYTDPVVTVETDPSDGHPTFIAIDWVPEAIDDEECHRISRFQSYPTTVPLPLHHDPPERLPRNP